MGVPRLGFLGLGWIGRARLSALVARDIAEVVVLVDSHEQSLEAARLLAPSALAVRKMAEAGELALDGLVIATPSALHAEQCMQALSKGIAVFCQKPLGRNALEVEAIIDLAREKDLLLGVDLSYRFIDGMRKLREMVQGGELGKVFGANLVFHNAYGPGQQWFYDRALSGGGCVIDLAVHLLDAACWILDGEVSAVTSALFTGGERLLADDPRVEDFAQALFKIGGETGVQLTCSWKLPIGQEASIQMEFYGTEGGTRFSNVNGSFYDFQLDRFDGPKTTTILPAPAVREEWGGRALVEWTERLGKSRQFDPQIATQVKVAKIMDSIYSCAN